MTRLKAITLWGLWPLPLSQNSLIQFNLTPEHLSPKLDLCRLSATEILALLRDGHVTVEEYARSLLKRLKERDPVVKAWIYLDEEAVLSLAKAMDAVPFKMRGPLHGIAIGIKDVALTKDMPTRYNSAIHEGDGPSSVDAATVSILRTAGALIFGKTATTEFAAIAEGGPCANPHNPKHTPGGSSSGSAAAVADYQIPIALGTQTGGSMLRPGSYNGIYAFKPTWGVVSSEGLGRFSVTCDSPGFYARTVEDLYLLASIFHLDSSGDPGPSLLSIQGARVAFVKTLVWPKAGTGTRTAWEQAHQLLSRNGAMIEDVDLPTPFDQCPRWRKIIVSNEARSSFLPQYLRCKEKLHRSLINLVESRNEFSRNDVLEAHNGIGKLRVLWDKLACQYDVIITPSAPDEAPEGLDSTGSSCFNTMWTILHAPALNVPGFTGRRGLPIGLTIVGARYNDMQVLQAGKIIGNLFGMERPD